MYTRCPKCSTCFRVTDRHLAVAKGKVRCGQCQLVFNAPENAIDDLPIKSTTAITSINSSLTTPPKTTLKKVSVPVQPKEKLEPEIKPTADKKISTTEFNAEATLIAPTNASPNNKADVVKDDDDLFDDSFDLNAAIDELTQATEEIDDNIVGGVSKIDKAENFSPTDRRNDNISATDAENTAAVSNIIKEMEGQLPLNISEPTADKKEIEEEFIFLDLEDEPNNSVIDDNTIQDVKIEVSQPTFVESIEVKNINSDAAIDENNLEYEIDENKLLEQTNDDDFQNNELDIPLELRNDIKRLQMPTPTRFHPLIVFSFFIILVILSFSQLAYFRAHQLISSVPSSMPLIELFCNQLNCNYSGPLNTKKIQLLSRDVRLHPKEKKALLISAALVNNADFAQPYPKIHIRLSDISGNVVAERIFNAKTYLGKLNNPFLLMKPKIPVHIKFEVVDPGKDAINFEFTFL